VATLALKRALEILQIDPSPYAEKPEYFRLLTLQKEVAASVLGTVARIDESRLKGIKKDRMAELLDAIKAAEG